MVGWLVLDFDAMGVDLVLGRGGGGEKGEREGEKGRGGFDR